MKFIADLHLHSKYSRATAKNLDLENLYHAAKLKGVTVVGTGDFTHPAWIEEIKTKLEQAEPGLFRLKKEYADPINRMVPETCKSGSVRFVLQSEISNIYKKNDRVRKNHNLVYFPDYQSVDKFNAVLEGIGNIKSDGRPILGLDAKKLLEIMLDVNEKGMFVPAHIWTPWFSLFGSKSGFDSMAECFEELTNQIFAVETGLSSDPPMNWRFKELDRVRLISSSDAHSPGVLGRNASVFNTDLSFTAIRSALETNDLSAYHGTLDMYPDQGKYHYDGHRKCNICLNPATTQKIDGICPACGRPLTCGVLYRVQELADRPEGYQPENRHGYRSIIPLTDILSEIFKVGPKTKKVATFYKKAIENLGPELQILLDLNQDQIESAGVPLLGEAVNRMRKGNIHVDPGFDGEYGVVNIFSEEDIKALKGEDGSLFDIPVHKKTRKKRAAVIEPGEISPRQKKRTNASDVQKDDLLGTLNPEQKSAVESLSRAVVVQAGPGTGKTRTLTAKIAWLVSQQKVNPGVILALTFTNKAATQLSEKIQTFLPTEKKGAAKVTAATFHAFCLSLLKRHLEGFSAALLDDEARLDLIKRALGDDDQKKDIKAADAYISACKQQLIDCDDENKRPAGMDDSEGRLILIYRRYQSLCRRAGVVDFEDLIFMTVRMMEKQPEIHRRICETYRYVFIDEYQDLNYGQYVLAKFLADENHVFVIGDPDQSIYGFRGSDNKYFKLFEQDFPGAEKIFLKQNYRSTQTILDASFQVIAKAQDSDPNAKVFSDIEGLKHLIIKETASDQAEAVSVCKMIENLVGGTSFFSMDSGRAGKQKIKEYAFSDFAVLFRTSKQGRAFAEVLEKEGIPFQNADRRKVFKHKGLKQLISFCRLVSGQGTLYDLQEILKHHGVNCSEKIRAVLSEIFSAENKSLEQLKDQLEKSTVVLSGRETKELEKVAVVLTKVLEIKNACDRKIQSGDFPQALQVICDDTGLNEIIKGSKDARQAFELLLQKASVSESFPAFLEAVLLGQDADALISGVEKVSLMTLHAAKGLEFPVVFVAGCEQGLIPFARDGRNVTDLEEERRLFYVGMTRAMDILCLTYAKKRRIYGTQTQRQRSLFIEDIEKLLLKVEKSAARAVNVKKEKQLELF